MGTYHSAVDAYIEKSADFAKPILEHFRELIHSACPEAEEKIKWSFPHFDYGGEMMCSMAAFKQHASIGFWKAALMKDPVLSETAKSEIAMGHLGKLTSLKDLPPDKKITSWIKEAMKLNDDGIKLIPKPKSTEKTALIVPDKLTKGFADNRKAKETYDSFSFSKRKEYIEWIVEAKTEATRNRRVAMALGLITEGKSLHWKYQ